MKEYTVTTLNDHGYGSFRYGLKNASKITFSITGTIILEKDLPIVNHSIIIKSSNDVIINCNGFQGMILGENSSSSEIDRLYLMNSSKNGLVIQSSNNTIKFSKFINNKENGILIEVGGGNTLFHNLLSNNLKHGIALINSDSNTFKNNYIGVDITGLTINGNFKSGMYFLNSNKNIIGGTEYGTNNPTGSKGTETPTFVVPYDGNLISGNKEYGILMKKCNLNFLYGNFIGTNATGNGKIANGLDGMLILECTKISLIGCTGVQNPFVYYNILSGNDGNGLHITDSDHIIVHGNFFGIAANNAERLPNDENGILIDGNSHNVQIGYYIPLGNVVSGNRKNGLYITGNATTIISYNTFGGLSAFGLAIPNQKSAIKIDSTNEGLIGIRTCVLSGNRENGIYLKNTKNIIIDSIICGLATDGTGFIPNEENNLLISNSHDVSLITHAKSVIFTSNIFGGSRGMGILLTDKTYNVNIESCFIGVNILGKTPFSNYKNGIQIENGSHDNIVTSNINLDKTQKLLTKLDKLSIENSGFYLEITETPVEEATTALESLPNIISGNDVFGIYLDKTTYNNAIVNNYVGFNVDKTPVPNYKGQIINKSDRNVVKDNYVYEG